MKTDEDLLFEKGLPANVDAERFVLGSAMLSEERLLDVVGVLDNDDYSLEKHRRIDARMRDLLSRGSPVDRVTLAHELKAQGQLDSVDGLSYLISLDEGLPTIVNLDAYISIVKDTSRLRKAIFRAKRFINDCVLSRDQPSEILSRAERILVDLGETDHVTLRTPLEVVTRAGGITAVMDPKRQTGVPSPFEGLNQLLVSAGFSAGSMNCIGARPGIGKSALACQLADHAATQGIGTVLFTLEMADVEITNRLASRRARVNYIRIRQGWAKEEERNRFERAYAELTDDDRCKLWIDDTTSCSVAAMRSALRRHMARHQVGLVVVDYLQLMESGHGDRRRYVRKILANLARHKTALARELKNSDRCPRPAQPRIGQRRPKTAIDRPSRQRRHRTGQRSDPVPLSAAASGTNTHAK